MKGYKFFWSGPLSQWHRSNFKLGGVAFVTAEQAMNYLKACLFKGEKIAARNLNTPDPGAQKALGRKVRGFDERTWRKQREEVVNRASHAKFDQNEGLRRTLFQSAGLELVEASPVDTIWGIGLSARDARTHPPANWPGLNMLGKTLTRIRDELIRKYPEHARSVAQANVE